MARKFPAQLDREIAESLSSTSGSMQQPFYGLRIIPSERAGYTPGKHVVQYKDRNGMWFGIGDPKSKERAEAALRAERHRVVKQSHATMKPSRASHGTWAVEAGRGLTFDRGDGRGPLLMFNLHRAVEPRTGSSNILPVELDEITHEVAAFLNRKKRKLKPSPGY